MALSDLKALMNASAQNMSQFKGLSAAYGILLGGTPSIDGYTNLINTNNTTNFGAGGTTVFNDENIYINTINALYQGNPTAKASFDSIVAGSASIQDALTAVYNFVIPAASRTQAGLDYFKSQASFYAARAAELGVAGTNGTALVAFASLTKIAVDNDIPGLGDTINDLRAAVDNNTAAIPQSGAVFTPLETADGTGFDGDDLAAGGGNQTFNLTTSVDNLTGTASADTFNGSIGGAAPDPASTFNSGDKLEGGGGVDRLNVTVTAAATTPIVVMNSIEEARFTNISGNTSTLSAAAWTGLTSVGSVNSTNTQVVNNLQNNVTAVLSGVSLANNADALSLGFAADKIGSTSGALSLDVTGVGSTTGAGARNDVVVDVAGTDQFTTVNLKASGQNFIGLSNTGGGGSSDIKLTTLNVTGDGFARIALADGADATVYTGVKTVDASGNKGGVRLDETLGAGAALTVTGGAGNDTFTVDTTAGGAANKTTVALGAGDDVLNLVSVTNYTAVDSLKGGDGAADVIGFATAANAATIAGAAADVRATISEFEIVRVAGAGSSDFNISKISSANYLQLETATAVSGNTVSGFTSGATVEYRAAANSAGLVTVGITNATDANTPSDTLNIKFNADLTVAGTNTLQLATPGINILNVSTADRDASSVTFGTGTTAPVAGYGLNLSQAADVTTINVTGDRTLTLSGSGNIGLEKVEAATATGNVTLDMSGFTGTQGVTYNGGTAIDTFTGTRFGDVVTGGSGNDILVGRGGNDKIDGGAGNDQITGDGIDPGQQTTSATFNLGALNYELNENIEVVIAGTTVTSADLAAGATPTAAATALATAINGNATLTAAGITAVANGANVNVTTTGAAFTVALGGGGDGVTDEVANTVELDVFQLPVDGANAASYAISFNGTQVAISAAGTVDGVGAALAAQLSTALAANQLGATTAVTYNAAANTLTLTGPASGAAINYTATKDGAPFALDGTSVTGVATNQNVVTFTNNAVGTNGADVLTGGAGNDTFIYNGLAQSTVTVTDTITDLELGSAGVGGRVDVVQLTAASGFTGGAITVANAGNAITGVGANITAAVTAVTGAGGLLQNANTAGLLTFGTDTYLVVSDGLAATTNDLVIKVTGYTGTLDASDFIA